MQTEYMENSDVADLQFFIYKMASRGQKIKWMQGLRRMDIRT
jgi:hypothetical protein